MMKMMKQRRKELFFIFYVFSTSASNSFCAASASSFSNVIQSISRRGQATLTKSAPALRAYNVRGGQSTSKVLEVAVKRNKKRRLKLPKVDVGSEIKSGGFYYGITSKTLTKATKSDGNKRPSLSDSMFEALEELRIMRQEMETMRKDMQTLKRKMIADGDLEEDSAEATATALNLKRKRSKECEKLAVEVELWAHQILKETEEDGWKKVSCNKMMRQAVNPSERTTTFLKWMPDSRGEKADKNDETEYPCIKCVARIDAPLEDVCTYLAEESAAPDYNDVVVKYKDLEEISPNAKICYSESPQILFVKPRDFITFCHHRWKGDGTEVIVNQATEHPDYPASYEEREGKACRAYALRGANFMSRCPDDPEKTIITIVAHANPGGGIPQWAAKTAVNALVPIEPFKLFHKINENVKRKHPQLRERLQQAELVSTLPPGRSFRPAGMAQLGYACFWPNGGGLKEGGSQKPKSPEHSTNTPEMEQSNEGAAQMESEGNQSNSVSGSAVTYSGGDLVESS